MEVDKRTREKKLLKLMMLPLAFIVGFIPLIVRIQDATPKGDIQGKVLQISEYYDFFSQTKADVLLKAVILMAILGFFLYDKYYVKKERYTLIAVVGSIIFLIGTVLSTIFSEYREVAIWGVYDRAEGMVTILCYVFIMLYSIYAFNEYKDIKYIIVPLAILVILNVVCGITQYFGHDLFMESEKIKQIIVPDELAEIRKDLAISYAKGRLYGTVGHYNYMGSLAALLVSFFAVLTMMLKGKVKKVLLGLITLASLFLLFGSTSRAGIVGVMATLLLIIIIMGKRIIQHWKFGIGALVGIAVLSVFLNVITQGSIFERIPSLIKDMGQIIGIGSEAEDYRDYLPIREFRNEDGEVIIVLQDGEIHFKVQDGKIVATDEFNQPIQYEKITEHIEEYPDFGTYSTQNPQFSNIQYDVGLTFQDGQEVRGFSVGTVDESIRFTCRMDVEQGILQQIDRWTGEDVLQETAPAIGFKGKERIGSARGYIWSRTLPMLKDTVLLGKGPDNFAFYFTRSDTLAKQWAYETTKRVIIDKPHNLYLQIAFNEGVIALIGFLILIGSYLVRCIKLYAFKSIYTEQQSIGLAVAAGVVGYLGAGMFNDSVVSVAPIFWVLLGIGIAINEKIAKEQEV